MLESCEQRRPLFNIFIISSDTSVYNVMFETAPHVLLIERTKVHYEYN